MRRRIAGKYDAFLSGYAPIRPPAIAMMVSVIAADGVRLAMALAPTTAIASRTRSYIGVRLDPRHPDVAVLDPNAAPEEMRAQYEAAMAVPGFSKPSVGWGTTARWGCYGPATGTAVGLVIGFLLP